MDKYAQYVKERTGAELFEDENGFFVYRVDGRNFMVDEIFVLPENRKNGIGRKYSDMIDKMSRENGCSQNICTVCVRSNNYIESFNFIKKMGYKVFKDEYTLLYLIKEL